MTTRRIAALSLAVLATCAAVASAQEPPAPVAPMAPFRGLFGPPAARPARKHTLDFTGQVYGGYDQNVSGAVFQGAVDPRLKVPSWLAGAGGGLNYSRPGRRVSFGASVFTGVEYLFDLSQWAGSGFTSGATFGISLGPNTSMSVGGGVSYRPYYRLAPVVPLPPPGLGSVAPPQPNYFLSPVKSWDYGAGVGFSHAFTKRLSFNAGYDARYYDFVDPTVNDSRVQTMSAGVRYALWKYVGLRLGYTYRRTTYLGPPGPDVTYDDQGYDVGLDAGRTWQFDIPLGRRTTLGFAFGTGVTTTVRDNEPHVYFNVLGNAYLTHWFNDRWRFVGGYNRSVGFVDGLTDQWVTDLFYATLVGYLSSRVSVAASSTYAIGNQLGGPGNYDTWSNTARLQVAITRNLAGFAEYFDYRYFYKDTQLLPGLPDEFNRRGFRVGLTLWVPLIR